MSPMLSIQSTPMMFVQLVLALAFGMILGIERLVAGRTAGPRTYGLVSLGSCLVTMISLLIVPLYATSDKSALDPILIVSTIISGVGFLAAGLIVFNQSKLSGLTTAAGVWVSAIVGIAVGYGFYSLAFFTTLLTLFVFSIMWRFERIIKQKFIHLNGSDFDDDLDK